MEYGTKHWGTKTVEEVANGIAGSGLTGLEITDEIAAASLQYNVPIGKLHDATRERIVETSTQQP